MAYKALVMLVALMDLLYKENPSLNLQFITPVYNYKS